MNRPLENTNPRPEPEKDPRSDTPRFSRHESEQNTGYRRGAIYTPPPVAAWNTFPKRVETGPPPVPPPEILPEAESGAEDELAETADESASEQGSDAVHNTVVVLSEVESGGDVMVAGGDVTKLVHAPVVYRQGPALLRSREIGRDEPLSDELFVSTGRPELLRSGVYVLIGPPHTGRRTVGLRTLRALPEKSRLREFLPPDWDEPDMERIPSDPHHAYLLDLTGTGEALTEQFAEDLARYAERAVNEEHGPLLVVLGDEEVGRKLARVGDREGVVVQEHHRPDALDIARRRIRASRSADAEERQKWLDDRDGAFYGLVSPDAPPSRGVRLAEVVLSAADKNDRSVLGPFLNWQEQIQDWFSSDVREENAKGAETRSLRVAAAFLNGQPAPAVLNAADELLPAKVRERFELWGGALAAPDDHVRCREADLAFRDGRIYITDGREGIDFALIRYLWDRRGSVADSITAWLSGISAPEGAAEDCLDRLSEVLTEVAVAQGSSTVLVMLERWLKQGARQRTNFVVDVLQRLTEHEDLGPRVRVVDLRNWAKGSGSPDRQRAVIAVCGGSFGERYPEQALMRLRYVVQTARDADLRQEAVDAVAERFDPGRPARLAALEVLVDWIEDERTTLIGGRLFLDLFGGAGTGGKDDPTDPARGLLTSAGQEGDEAEALFTRAWRRTWNHPELRKETSHALAAWRDAAETEVLPLDRTRRVLSIAFEAAALDEDVDRIVDARGRVGSLLRRDFWAKATRGIRQGGERSVVPE